MNVYKVISDVNYTVYNIKLSNNKSSQCNSGNRFLRLIFTTLLFLNIKSLLIEKFLHHEPKIRSCLKGTVSLRNNAGHISLQVASVLIEDLFHMKT